MNPDRLVASLRSASGAGVTVAVVDSGVRGEHPHVLGVAGAVDIVPGAGGFAAVEGPHGDRSGHGTACAGVIRMVAPGARLVSVRVLDAELRSTASALAFAIREAAERARIINVSSGTTDEREAFLLDAACAEAAGRGALVVAAEAPGGGPSWPARCSSAVGVAGHPDLEGVATALDPDTGIIYAAGTARPPGGIPPARNFRGSSFAAPRVSGILARLLEAHPELLPAEAKAILAALASRRRP